MTSSLYLILERGRRSWQGVRIVKVSKRKPVPPKPSVQAVVRLLIDIPDNVLQPRELRVEIKPEHMQQPVVTVQSTQP